MQFLHFMHEKPKEKKWFAQSHSGVNSDPAHGTFAFHSFQHSKSLPLTLCQGIGPRVNREPLFRTLKTKAIQQLLTSPEKYSVML
jgi:hypothetical protein